MCIVNFQLTEGMGTTVPSITWYTDIADGVFLNDL
jgi:hypothetical protein